VDGMRKFGIELAVMVAICVGVAIRPASAQDAKVDIRGIPCSELDRWEEGDRIAAIFFFYGFHAALLNAYEVTPANLERNVRNVVEFCGKNPTLPLFEAMPKAFQR
jgi:hypothetical protein